MCVFELLIIEIIALFKRIAHNCLISVTRPKKYIRICAKERVNRDDFDQRSKLFKLV